MPDCRIIVCLFLVVLPNDSSLLSASSALVVCLFLLPFVVVVGTLLENVTSERTVLLLERR